MPSLAISVLSIQSLRAAVDDSGGSAWLSNLNRWWSLIAERVPAGSVQSPVLLRCRHGWVGTYLLMTAQYRRLQSDTEHAAEVCYQNYFSLQYIQEWDTDRSLSCGIRFDVQCVSFEPQYTHSIIHTENNAQLLQSLVSLNYTYLVASSEQNSFIKIITLIEVIRPFFHCDAQSEDP